MKRGGNGMRTRDVTNRIINEIKHKKIITEEELISLLEKNGIPFILTDEVVEELISNGIDIVDYQDNDKNIKNSSTVITQRVKSYKKEKEELLNKTGEEVKKQFYTDLDKPRIQATYIPLTIIGFLNCSDYEGRVSIDRIVDTYKEFYENRKNHGLIVERKDSVFSNSIPDDEIIKKLILFNPLGRSFLVKYFTFDRKSELVSINHNLWDALTAADISRIRGISNRLINDYYNKL